VESTTAELTPVDGIRVERPRDGVTLVVIDRPDRYNAVDEPLLVGLAGLVEGLADDPATRAVVVCGAGSAFCTGGDLDLLRRVATAPVDAAEDVLRRAQRAAVTLRRLPQPTIAAINGPVAGAGLGLALACDIRIASPTATFNAPLIHMGLVPDMGVTWLLPRLVDVGVALELLLSGRQIEAGEAHSLGLVTRLSDDPVGIALAMAATFAAMPPKAVTVTKVLLHRALGRDLESAVAAEAQEQAAALHRRGVPEEDGREG